MLLSSPSTIQRNGLGAAGNPVTMADRDEPDLDRVREALREHDERRESEQPPPERKPEPEPEPQRDDEPEKD